MATLRWAPVVSTMGAEVGLFHTAWPPCAPKSHWPRMRAFTNWPARQYSASAGKGSAADA